MRLNSAFQQTRCLPCRGFTLIELIIVLSILATLVGLILPGIETVRRLSKEAHCARNLREIGIAYHLFVDGNGGKPSSFRTNAKWMNQLKPYLGDNSQVFVCPLDIPKEIPRSELKRASVDFPVGISTLDWRIARTLAIDGLYCRLSSKPGPTPGSFYLELRIQEKDEFQKSDLLLLVEPETDDMVRLTAASNGWSEWYGTYLKSPSRGLIGLFFETGAPITLPKYEVPSPSEPAIIQLPIASSYGVNSMADYYSLSDDGGKVLVAEYKHTVCNVVNNSELRRFATDTWYNDCEPRHDGRLNVLFLDGSVQATLPTELNPRVQTKTNQYWLPSSLKQ